MTAFRDWRIFGDELLSPFTGTLWTEPVQHAVCRPQSPEALRLPPHAAPHPDCRCGISAWLEPSDESSKVNFRAVSGVVSVWGRLAVGEDEVRAEHAQIECLALYSGWTARHKAAARAIAGALGVEVVDLYDLAEAAVVYGSRLPDTLVPRAGGERSLQVAA